MADLNPDDQERVWPAMVRAYQNVRSEAESALKHSGLNSLEEYDVLLELRRAEKPISLSQLETETLLRQYQISRLVDRLVVRGLVQRSTSKHDARSRLVTLTAHGRAVQKAAGRAYLRVLKRRFAKRLDSREGDLMKRLLDLIASD